MSDKPRSWGGKRPGSGRKPKQKPDYDDKFKKKVLKIAKKLEKVHGKPIEEAVLEMVYDSKTQDAVKASIWKSFIEMFTVQRSSQDVKVTGNDGPAIMLPPINGEDPALKVVK
jgi:hypothetical protein